MKCLCRITANIFFIICLILCCTIQPYAIQFIDVNDSDFDNETYEAILYVSDNGFMNGTGSSCFSPNTEMTRAQAVMILYSLAGYPPSGNYYIPWPRPYNGVN